MGLQLFYAQQTGDSTLVLPPDEARHAFKVLRHNTGDVLHCIDGNGNMFRATIKTISDRAGELEILETVKNFGCHSWDLHMAVSIIRNPDRYEWFVEKAVEIGVDEITPIVTSRAEKKRINVERLQKIAMSALKQSQKSKMPKIYEPVELMTFLQTCNSGQRYIAHCDASDPRKWLYECLVPKTPAIILIGPEGDFSPEEIAAAKNCNFKPVIISGSTLRTETAGVVCCQIVAQVNSK